MPLVLKRVEACREARIAADTVESRKLALTPMLFREQLNPESYLIIPVVSSERRRYIPTGFLVYSDKLFYVEFYRDKIPKLRVIGSIPVRRTSIEKKAYSFYKPYVFFFVLSCNSYELEL